MLLLVLALLAPQDIQVSAEVDRDRIEVGEAVTYTVRAIVDAGSPVVVTLPDFDGFTVTSRTDSREPRDGSIQELYVLELRLRGDRPGLWEAGPIRVQQGTGLGLAPAVEIMVQSARVTAPRVSGRVIQLVQRARPPRVGEVGVSLLISADTVRIGEQVDVVTAAWFPRATLDRLRRPPSIRPPNVDGVYSAVQPSAAGVAVSRDVGGVWYDVYVAHQVIFPVREGVVVIPPAGLSFGMPSGRQYFSDERTVQLASEGRSLTVLPLPPGGPGPVASGLAFRYELSPEPARVGSPIPVDLVLSGAGNVALWPAPVARWPDGSRGYPEDVVDEVQLRNGLVSGSKRVRYLVIADSAGSLGLPDVRYAYFDAARGAWSEATARSVVVPVQPALENARRRDPLPVLDHRPSGLALLSPPARTALLLMSGLVPLVLLGVLRLRGRTGAAVGETAASPLLGLQAAVRILVPDADDRREERLTHSLREAGLDAGLSREAARTYHQIATKRFDPGQTVAQEAIETEARRILGAWPRRLRRVVWVAVAAMAAGSGAASGQQPGPRDPVAWYEAGARAYQAGQDARAAADWMVARRLAPRSPEVRQAWARLARLSRDLSEAGRVFPLTPVELFLLAIVAWILGWLAWFRWRWSRMTVVLLAGAAAAAAGTIGLTWWYARPVAVVSREASLRQAPHGLASESGRAAELAVVTVVSSRPGWRLVEGPGGVRGWVPAAALAEVRQLDFGP